VPEAADVSLLAGLVFSEYCKIVFTSSTRHWHISELCIIGQLTDKPSSRKQSSRGLAGLVNSQKCLMKNSEYRNSRSVILVDNTI